MMARRRTTLLALLVALIGLLPVGAAGAAGAAAPPMPAVGLPASAQTCVASGKVWVLAINERGGTVASGCVNAGGTGKSLLKAVASVAERATDAGFVCQINEVPDRCIEGSQWNLDPRYWQYHHAEPGGSWVYSNLGYTNRTPRPGSIEGWCLSAGSCAGALGRALDPGSVPGYVPAPATTSAPTTKAPTKAPTNPPTRATSSAPTTRTVAARTTSASTSTPAARATTSSSPTTPTTAPSTTAAASPRTATVATATTPGPSSTAPTEVSSPPTTTASPSPILATPASGGTGTAWGAIATGGLVAASAGAFLLVRARRGVTSDQ